MATKCAGDPVREFERWEFGKTSEIQDAEGSTGDPNIAWKLVFKLYSDPANCTLRRERPRV